MRGVDGSSFMPPLRGFVFLFGYFAIGIAPLRGFTFVCLIHFRAKATKCEGFSLKFEAVQSATSSDLMVTSGCIEKGTTLEI